MIKKRETYKIIVTEPAATRIKENRCPSCGLHKNEWRRRIDWRCCSTKCTGKFTRLDIIYGWQDLRERVFKRDDYICKDCGNKFDSSKLDGDHIKPIALGGDQWDMDNVQTLCYECHKIKTKKDAQDIAKARRIDKVLRRGQVQLT